MSTVYSLEGIDRKKQIEIDKRLTVRAETIQKGKIIYGEPIKTYTVSEDKKWISVPIYIGKELFSSSICYDFTPYQSSRTSMKFTAELIENEKRDQQTSMKEALPLFSKHKSLLLNLRTGYGKTICAIYLACQVKKRTLILSCRESLIDGWKTECKSSSNCKVVVVKPSGKTNIPDDTDIIISIMYK